MYISLNWLKDYVDINVSPLEVEKQLTMRSAEVESVKSVNEHLKTVKTAKIEKVLAHPNSEKLHLVEIFDGNNRETIVCGAGNIAEGQIVPYAPLGAVLPGDFEIKPAKIRGVESKGMLCSEKELGLGEDHEGIMQFDKNLEPGTLLKDVFAEPDFVLEIENKTINNRPDLWGHYGIARELHAILDAPWKKKLEIKKIEPKVEEENFEIDLKSDKALFYLGLKISGIKIEESPKWLKTRLETVGVRSINNIVDITNYVMLETAHPMHAFDRRDISGNKIVVRDANDGEKFTTLDEIERTLTSEDVVIADEQKAVAIGGVMGGLNSEVKDDTTEIFVESALFSPSSIRRTANRLDLRTDSAVRFEKALWPENAMLAMSRFVELVLEIVPSAFISSKLAVADNSQDYGFKETIAISPEKIRTIIGVSKEKLSNNDILAILSKLEFEIDDNDEEWIIKVPAHRRSKDVSIASDIIEEVGRIYGYNSIEPVAPYFPMDSAPINKNLKKEHQLRDLLVKSFQSFEVLNYIFMSDDDVEKLNLNKEILVKTVENREASWLRNTMLPEMMRKVHFNLKNFKEFTLFEIGRVFEKQKEQKRLSIVMTGKENLFEEMKIVVETIAKELKIPMFVIERVKEHEIMLGDTILHPFRGAVLKTLNKKSAVFGEVHPEILKKYNIKTKVAYAEFDLDLLFSLPQKGTKYKPIPKYPSTLFEFTLVVEEKKEVRDIFAIITKSVKKQWLTDYSVISRYKGEPIPEGFQSLSFRVVLNAGDRTLTNEEMKSVQDKLIDDLRKKGLKLKGD